MDQEAPERSNRNIIGIKRNQREKYKGPRYIRGSRTYRKECTLRIDNIPHWQFSASKVIEALEKISGDNSILAVVPSENKLSYEITTDNEDNAMKLTNGFEIGENKFNCIFQFNDVVVVSFMHLPAYIEDEEIIQTLTDKGCEIKSDVFRHVHARTQVADGTRYVHVKFPPGMVSLPWSMKFETGLGPRYFRVVHNNQRTLCNKCGSPLHKYRQCPQLICDGCDEQGHKIKECTANKCEQCHKLPMQCFCKKADDGICPYCRANPCDCYCKECKKHFDHCSCGLVEEHDDRKGWNEDEIISENEMEEVIDLESDVKNSESKKLGKDDIENSVNGRDDDESNNTVDDGSKVMSSADNSDRNDIGEVELKSEANTVIDKRVKDDEAVDNEVSFKVPNVNVNKNIIVDVVVHKEYDDDVHSTNRVLSNEKDKEINNENMENMETNMVSNENTDHNESISVVCHDGANMGDGEIESIWDVSDSESDQTQLKKPKKKRRNKMKFFPNVKGVNIKVRSSPYKKQGKNG